MFSPQDVRALLHDQRLAPPVASLLVNTDRSQPEGERYLAGFRTAVHAVDSLLRRRRDAPSALARTRLRSALPHLLRFLEEEVERVPIIRGVALFVSLAPSPHHAPAEPPTVAFTLPRPLRTQGAVGRRPYIRPLLFLLDEYARVGVIVADRSHARIFTLFLGEIETLEVLRGETPPRHRAGGWKQMLLQRDSDGHARAHLRATVRTAAKLFRQHPPARLFLGGSPETTAQLTRELPFRLRTLLAGTFPAAPETDDRALVSAALSLDRVAEHREEERKVQALRDALARRSAAGWGKGVSRAVSGVADTLRALGEDRVQQLLLLRGKRVAGAHCDNCGALDAPPHGTCAICNAALTPVPDVLAHAVERAADEGASVEFVSESPSLEALGGVGAFLRF